jgi:hypothetical protein
MLQRKQTLWLLLSVICAALTFKFAFYHGSVANETMGVKGAELTATDNIGLIILTTAIIAVALIAIFLFKNRTIQFQLTFVGLILALGLIGLYFYYTQFFQTGGIALTALLNLGVVLGFFFALRGIRHDQKLIRDLNRLR